MYSYVAVGEFVAFIIGWNMILEYLIGEWILRIVSMFMLTLCFEFRISTGTSACACALSSSFDSLTGNAIARTISESIGTIFGEYWLLQSPGSLVPAILIKIFYTHRQTTGLYCLRHHAAHDLRPGDGCQQVGHLQPFTQRRQPGHVGLRNGRRAVLCGHEDVVRAPGIPALRLEWCKYPFYLATCKSGKWANKAAYQILK